MVAGVLYLVFSSVAFLCVTLCSPWLRFKKTSTTENIDCTEQITQRYRKIDGEIPEFGAALKTHSLLSEVRRRGSRTSHLRRLRRGDLPAMRYSARVGG